VSEKKADNLIETLLALGRLSLMIIGILGIAFEAFKENGLMSILLSKATASTTSMVVSGIIIIAIYLINRWLSVTDGNKSQKGDLPMYLMMAIGAFFIFRFISQ
jgi:hypothetical protein